MCRYSHLLYIYIHTYLVFTMAALSASAQPTTGVVYDPVFGSYECPWDRQHVENPERWSQGNICWQCLKIFPCQVRVRGAAVRGAGAAGALCPGGGQVMMVMMMVMVMMLMMLMMVMMVMMVMVMMV